MINRTIIQGRFTRKPEAVDKGGFSLCDFTIAWSEKYKETEHKCFMRCKAWRSTADFIAKYFDKGQEVLVEGYQTTEEWEKDGQKQSMNVLNVDKVHFCGKKSDQETSTTGSAATGSFMDIPADIAEELPFN